VHAQAEPSTHLLGLLLGDGHVLIVGVCQVEGERACALKHGAEIVLYPDTAGVTVAEGNTISQAPWLLGANPLEAGTSLMLTAKMRSPQIRSQAILTSPPLGSPLHGEQRHHCGRPKRQDERPSGRRRSAPRLVPPGAVRPVGKRENTDGLALAG